MSSGVHNVMRIGLSNIQASVWTIRSDQLSDVERVPGDPRWSVFGCCPLGDLRVFVNSSPDESDQFIMMVHERSTSLGAQAGL